VLTAWGRFHAPSGNPKFQTLNPKQISNIKPQKNSPPADSPLGFGAWDFFGIWSLEFGILSSLAVSVLLASAIFMFHQVRFWRNSETLFSHAVQVTKGNYLAYNNLGFYLWHTGKTAEAMENYRQALKISPGYEDALNNMGYALAKQKRPQEALYYY